MSTNNHATSPTSFFFSQNPLSKFYTANLFGMNEGELKHKKNPWIYIPERALTTLYPSWCCKPK